MPRGGRRPGSGRKPNPHKPIKPSKVLSYPGGPFVSPPSTNQLPPVEEFSAPDSLTTEERQVWLQQAPLAFRMRTLTRASAMAFERYCRIVVMERKEAESSARGGPNHRGILKQINMYELQFVLIPNGRPMLEPFPGANQPAQDDDDAFFSGRTASA